MAVDCFTDIWSLNIYVPILANARYNSKHIVAPINCASRTVVVRASVVVRKPRFLETIKQINTNFLDTYLSSISTQRFSSILTHFSFWSLKIFFFVFINILGPYSSKNLKSLLLLQIASELFQTRLSQFYPSVPHKSTAFDFIKFANLIF